MNYDRILDRSVRDLPVIEVDGFRFERHYSELKKDGRIDFQITLEDPDEDIDIRETLQLYPVRKGQACSTSYGGWIFYLRVFR